MKEEAFKCLAGAQTAPRVLGSLASLYFFSPSNVSPFEFPQVPPRTHQAVCGAGQLPFLMCMRHVSGVFDQTRKVNVGREPLWAAGLSQKS